MRVAEEQEYAKRQAGSAGGIIPAAIKKPSGYSSEESKDKNFVAGAVSATDSESETEFMSQLRGGRTKQPFKWTTEYEDILEEVLMKNQFDFRAASREFTKVINKDSHESFFSIDIKQL